MARFPRTEAEVLALSESMITRLTANAVLYPALPAMGPLSSEIIVEDD
jgi:hypothetical protein